MPTATDLVTDLPADFEVFGQAVATSMADLLGGTSGQVLAKNSNTNMDFVWTTPAGGGKVLQVVTATYSTATSTSSGSMSDTGLTATITPSAASSKVLVLLFQNGLWKTAGVSYQQMVIKLLRGATVIQEANTLLYTGTASELNTTLGTSYLDSPSTTSATTYKTQFNSAGAASTTVQNGGQTSSITLLEIGA